MSDDSLLQAVVAAEHAAIAAYGVLGGRLDGAALRLAQAADDGHRQRRDDATAALWARGAAVPASLPAYDVPAADRAAALALALRLEEGLAVRWLDLVSGTDDAELRRLAVAGLREVAVRAARWRALLGRQPPTVALPGAG